MAIFLMGVDTISREPKNRIVRLANGARTGVIGGRVCFETGMTLFWMDPRKTAGAKKGVLFLMTVLPPQPP